MVSVVDLCLQPKSWETTHSVSVVLGLYICPRRATSCFKLINQFQLTKAGEATGFLEIMVSLILLGVWREYYSSAPTHKRNKNWLVSKGVEVMLILRLPLFT